MRTRNCIYMRSKAPRRGNEMSAQGIALGVVKTVNTPRRGKRFSATMILLPFQGVPITSPIPQGIALG